MEATTSRFGSVLRATHAKLHELADRKQRLVDFFLDGKVDAKTYQERVLRLSAEMNAPDRN
jgi:heme oxygenase